MKRCPIWDLMHYTVQHHTPSLDIHPCRQQHSLVQCAHTYPH